LIAITFTDAETRVMPIPLSGQTIKALQERLLLFSTGQTRNAADILEQQRLDITQQTKTIESLHCIKALALEMHNALEEGFLDHFGHLLDQGWREKRSLSRIASRSGTG